MQKKLNKIFDYLKKSRTKVVIISFVTCIGLFIHLVRPHKKNMKDSVGHGAAHWGNHEWIVPYIDMDSSYVVTDPQGTIVDNVGTLFLRNHYKVKILNTINFSKSMRYNPFAYIHSEKDIIKMANVLFTALKGREGGNTADLLWDEVAKLFLQAVFGYIWYEAREDEQNMGTFLELLNAEVRENAIDLLFEDLEESLNKKSDKAYQKAKQRLENLRAKHPDRTDEIVRAKKVLKKAEKNLNAGTEHFAVRQWKKYKLAAGKMARTILITIGSKFSVFDIQEVRDLMQYDEMDLENIGKEKTILFIITSDTDRTFNFIADLLYSQLFDTLCYMADNKYGGRLPVHVRCIMDGFANFGNMK